MEQSSYKAHVLLLPYPGQGHINPMLHFSRRLLSKAIKTTLITSVFISKSMNFGSSIGSVDLDVISDGYDEGGFGDAGSIDDYLARLKTAGSRTLAELIKKHESSSNPVDCVIYEPFLPWALDVAKEHGLFAAAFFTQPCVVDYIYYNIHHKLLKLPVSETPVSISGLPLLELRDMPSFVNVPGSYPAYFQMVLHQFCNTERADNILINTFYKLEQEAVNEMSKVCPVLTIGPTIPSIYLDKRIENDDDYGLDLYALDASISINWMSTKPAGSVVYVAFGSMANLSDKQMEELAWGLNNSNFNFLWVVRACEQSKLPKGFVQELGSKGLIVNWSPQVKVLASEAIGCFFTHSGWNSTIEALSLSVPMVAMPQWTDQPPNAKLVEDVWKVGIRVKVNEDGIVTREEVESCIREVMTGEKGKEMRNNGAKWRELAIEAVSEGGTSDKNIDEFVSKLVSLRS
ncbi:UDP-glycosyltransferase 74F2 [Ricinus communis]|uniref:UDP-glycosyltransferase 74F2 n=1 Tax=Ricinus communis TaxID=3988 RepID=UPI0007725B61|nr:UDP-glycosyltransferase 74F2 [Ricinus communis]|eukprot:XP_015581232.1 UDP-glycosyltransferase 74F2 [Ricinus communis]